VAFSPDGTTILTGGEDKTAHLFVLPAEMPGDVERIVLWCEVLTGMALDPNGGVQILDASAWQAQNQRLKQATEPPLPEP
jgi:hypothetical protein